MRALLYDIFAYWWLRWNLAHYNVLYISGIEWRLIVYRSY
jgi:hypothetical protein